MIIIHVIYVLNLLKTFSNEVVDEVVFFLCL